MAIGDTPRRYPMLRLLLCYVAGIVAAHVLYPHVDMLVGWGSAAMAVALVVALVSYVAQRAWPFALSAALLFASLGLTGYGLQRRSLHYEWSPRATMYEARVVDVPRQQGRTTRCTLLVTHTVTDSATQHTVSRRILAHFDSLAAPLQPGDVICLHAPVRPPRDLTPDDRFDYARYLLQQGLSGTTYLTASQWHRVGEQYPLTPRQRMARLRHRLQRQHLLPLYQGDELGVLAALTLGDKQWLTPEARAHYAHAGASHALALSGLHVGILYGMLAFGLRGLRRRRLLYAVGHLVTITLLWLFALLVGMSPSVVRAVFMCTLYIVARWVSADSSSLHVLTFAALAMLLVRPLYLFDVGFQLSYMAMAAILTVGPSVEQLSTRYHLPWLIRYPLSIVALSVVAQLGTFPLTLHYFGTFPLYFLVTNLLVIPALTLLLPLMMVWWGLALLHIPLAEPFASLVSWLTHALNASLARIGSWPHAVLHVSSFTLPAVICTYLLILFLALALIKRWSRGFVWSLLALLGLVLCV